MITNPNHSCAAGAHLRRKSPVTRFLPLLVLAALLSAIVPNKAQAQAGFREDRILVKPKPGIDLGALHAVLGVQVLRSYPSIGNLQVLQLPAGSTVLGTIAAYQESGQVDYAERDFLVQGLTTPNDPHFNGGLLWGLHNTGHFAGSKPDADIDAPEAWDILHDAGTVIVAVTDSGIRPTHEDLAANLWINPGESGPDLLGLDKRFNGIDDDGNGYIDDVHGINAILGLGAPLDDQGHGTHVSGIIGAAANNAVGIVGVAWRVQLMSLKFLDALLNGSVSDAIECIDYARNKGAKVINASWGWYGFDSQALRDSIRTAGNAGIIFVAACGNSAINNDVNPLNPASFDLDNIVAVAATTWADQLADWSSYGATTVDLGAPGEAILSCEHITDFGYVYKSGTSMAAPYVAGACALLRSRYPGDTYRQIISRILSNTDPLPSLAGKCVTGGRLNLQKALSEEPVITVSGVAAEVFETGQNFGIIGFSRTGDPSQQIDVRWILSGTAVNGMDFQQLPTTSPFPTGAEAYLAITPIDDTQIESSETITITLLEGPGYRVGSPSSATVTIVDNDDSPPPPDDEPVISLSDLDPEAFEAGQDSGVIRFSRTGDPTQEIEVYWTFSGSGVNGSDFERLPTNSPFPIGSDAYLAIKPIDDTEVEGSETVTVTLVDGPGYRVGSPSSATVTIFDNDNSPPPPDDEPVISLSDLDPEAFEAGQDSGVIRFSRTGDPTQEIEVYWTFSGSAVNGSDFQRLPTNSPFPIGNTAYLTITPIDDIEVEGSETVTVTLIDGPGYRVGSPSSATVTIGDNDPPSPPVADFTASPLLGITPLIVEFTDRSAGNPVSWNWNFGDGSTSAARNPTHTYLLPGDYTATLTVRNSSGATSSKSVVIRASLLSLP